ncbi:MAG: hypothetical protein NVSMB47_04470 [Polyangiales bacterium]
MILVPVVAPNRGDVRLPLQTGASAVGRLAIATPLAIGGCLIAGTAAYVAFATHSLDLLFGGVLTLGGAAFALSARSFRLAWRWRPADVVLREDGVRIEGGPFAWLFDPVRAWDDLDLPTWRLVTGAEADERGESGAGAPPEVVQLCFGGLAVRAIAEAEDGDEADSLHAILDTVVASAQPDDAPPTPTSADVLRCPQCGAPLVPDDAQQVACVSCGAAVPLDPEVQARIAAERVARRDEPSIDHALRTIFAQRPAAFATTILGVAGLVMVAIWPAVIALALAWRHRAGPTHLVALGLVALAIDFAAWALVRLAIVDRSALQLIGLSFAASAPADGGAPTCRQCFAPLPVAPDAVVVRCAYCAAENVLGVDLRLRAARAQKDIGTLSAALEDRSARRQGYFALALVATVLAVGAVALLVKVERDAARIGLGSERASSHVSTN